MRSSKRISAGARGAFLVLGVLYVAGVLGSIAVADQFQWTNPVNGSYGDPSKWTNLTGADAAPPDAGDEVFFSQSGSYDVVLRRNETADELHQSAGSVRLVSDTATVRTLTISTDGGATDPDIDVNGGDLTVGAVGAPVVLTGGDAILFAGVTTDGLVSVVGDGSVLTAGGANRTHPVGALGGAGALLVSNSAVANIGYTPGSEGTLDVGVSNTGTSRGDVLVDVGGVVNAGALSIATRTSDAVGFVMVDGGASSIDVLQATTVGSASGGAGELNLQNGASFSTDTLVVRATGVVNVDSGATLGVDGLATIDAGRVNLDGGALALPAGESLTASAGAVISDTGTHNIANGVTYRLETGARLEANDLDIANTPGLGDGALVVNSAEVFAPNNNSSWGLSGNTAEVMIQHKSIVTLGSLRLGDSTNNSSRGVLTIDGESSVTVDSLRIATQASGAAVGEVSITNSSLFVTNDLVVGGDSSAVAAIFSAGGQGQIEVFGQTVVNSSGVFNRSGTVEFIAAGGFLVDGGTVNGTVDVSIGGSYVAQNGAEINVETLSIGRGQTYEITSGSTLTSASAVRSLTLGFASLDQPPTGTLIVDDAPVDLSSGTAVLGVGSDATMTFRNNAVGGFGRIEIGVDGAFESVMTVEGGADITAGPIFIDVNTPGSTGTLNVDGVGSTLTLDETAPLNVGNPSPNTGTATVAVTGGGSLTTGTPDSTVYAGSTLRASGSGGVLVRGDILFDGGDLFALDNAFRLAPGRTLTAASGSDIAFGGFQITDGQRYVIDDGSTLGSTSPASIESGGTVEVMFGSSMSVGNPGGSVVTSIGSTGDGSVAFSHTSDGFFQFLEIANVTQSAFGTLTVASGSIVSIQGGIALSASGGGGDALIDVNQGTVTMSGSAALGVGSGSGVGSGRITVVDGVFETGASLATVNATGSIEVGSGGAFRARGDVLVDGGRVDVSSSGSLSIDPGTTMRADNGAEVTFASAFGLFGQVLEIAGDSTVDVGSDLLLQSATGGPTTALHITDGGRLVAASGDLGVSSPPDSLWSVSIEDADSAWVVAGDLRVGGLLGTAEGPGVLTLSNEGQLDVGGDILLQATSTIRLDGGTLAAGSIDDTHNGTFDFESGRLSVGTYDGDLTNQGGTLAPGASPGLTTILGGYTQQSGATLEIEIGGVAATTEYDQVNVGGDALLGGQLAVSLIDGFAPDPSDTFTVLAANNLFGVFDNAASGARLTTTNGTGSFLVEIDLGGDIVVLSDFQLLALPGDYNSDGVVDAADYTVWRDGDSPDSTQAGYDTWAANYGRTASATTVPEPAGIALLLVAATACTATCRRTSGLER